MKLPRRKFLYLAAGAAALPAVTRFAKAQGYPSRSLRWIIGFPPGGGADTVARIMEPWLWHGLSSVVNASLFVNLQFDIQRDIAPVAGIVSYPMIMVAHPSVPAKN